MNERVNTYQEEIVHIETYNEKPFFINFKKKVWINITLIEAQLHEVAIDPFIPSPEGLFQPIEGFIQLAYIFVSVLDFGPDRLLHINLFLD